MTDVVLEKLKYPVGRFLWVERLSHEEIKSLTEEIRSFPAELKAEIQDYKPEDFQKTYRPGAWQIGQLIHHLADSHIHVYTRFKLALTQDTPTVLDYDHDQWAEMSDALDTNVKSSLMILEGIHYRWAALIETLDSHQWEKQYYHPARDKFYPLATVLALYAWHGKHHLAHIKNTP
ncbi:MAG: YfiT family bacillithiol transferase [Flavobacteriaceae bacterium]